MQILVTGGTGVVGWSILSRGADLAELSYTFYQREVSHPSASGCQLNIRERESVEELILKLNPDAIIHSAAMTDVDECESYPEEAHATNVCGTKNILEAAGHINAHVVFISTSFVFDGSKQPHKIGDSRNPVNVYGKTKAEAEKSVERSDVPSVIIRTDQPYGWTESWQDPTMVEWTLEQLADAGVVSVFDDWYNVPTYIPDLADAALWITSTQRTGVCHAVGPDYLSRYDWACKIAENFGYDGSKVSQASSEDVDLPAERPNVYLEQSSSEGWSYNDFQSLNQVIQRMAANK